MAIVKETPVPEEDFHPAVRLLLARMESDPDEFAREYKWEKLLDQCRSFCTPEEGMALTERYRAIRMDAVHVNIMRVITGADEGVAEDMYATDAIPFGGATIGGVAVGRNHTATELLMQQSKAQQAQQALQSQMAATQQSLHSIYGNSLSQGQQAKYPFTQITGSVATTPPRNLFDGLFGKK